MDTGGLEPGRVRNGQWWRLLTAMWLHAGLVHLAVNLVGIFYIGVPLEREFGPGEGSTIVAVGQVIPRSS